MFRLLPNVLSFRFADLRQISETTQIRSWGMMKEANRLRAVHQLNLLHTPREKEYDDLALLASVVCDTPISLISLLDEERQWFKATVGLEEAEAPRNLSFCTLAMQQTELMEIEYAVADPRFSDNPYVTGEMHLRFYAAVPLCAPGGIPVGALCVADRVPRKLTEAQRQGLTILAERVESQMNMRLTNKSVYNALVSNRLQNSTLQEIGDLFFSFMRHGPFASYIKDANGAMVFYNKYLADASGVTEEEWIGLKDEDIWPPEMAEKFRRNDVEVLEGNKAIEHREFSPAPGGGCVFWKTIKFPYVTKGGKKMLAGISMDITGEVLSEALLEDALRTKDPGEAKGRNELLAW